MSFLRGLRNPSFDGELLKKTQRIHQKRWHFAECHYTSANEGGKNIEHWAKLLGPAKGFTFSEEH